jgi:hypothetical protein
MPTVSGSVGRQRTRSQAHGLLGRVPRDGRFTQPSVGRSHAAESDVLLTGDAQTPHAGSSDGKALTGARWVG